MKINQLRMGIEQITDNAYNRHGILTVFRGRGYASLSPPPDGVQPPMKEDGKQSKPPLGGVGVLTEKKGFLCALKKVNFVRRFGIICNFAEK